MTMALQLQSNACNLHLPTRFSLSQIPSNKIYATSPSMPPPTRRRALSLFTITTFLSGVAFSHGCSSNYSWSKPVISDFVELPNSGGVKALDLRIGDDGETPRMATRYTLIPLFPYFITCYFVVIHYYGRLAAKQGWRFDSTYDHKDENGEPIPFEFVLGSGKVISGIESAVRSMKVGGIRRVIIPPSEGYQNTSQEPIPPNFFDRQRLFTTIFNPTRLANGEGSTLGTLIFDIELVSLRRQ
ncbi:hypothetical protein Pfo_023586 [Paulownia fortunei]|nr:hypothetical protein Pfo_023586 [Paulownia fortunei]